MAKIRTMDEVVALGASGSSMRNMILRDGVALIVAGMAIGLVLSWALARLLTAMLYGVSAHDPVAIVATLRPAIAATRVDPLKALR